MSWKRLLYGEFRFAPSFNRPCLARHYGGEYRLLICQIADNPRVDVKSQFRVLIVVHVYTWLQHHCIIARSKYQNNAGYKPRKPQKNK